MDGKNKLYFGDNLKILREYVEDASVDLVYLDPPFNSSATYNVLFKEKSGEESSRRREARARLSARVVRLREVSILRGREMAKGLTYELEVAKAVEAELANGNLGLDPAQAKVRHRPSYFSLDRKSDIVFDVSIEVRRKGASEPYWVWVWECKNYGHSVPVDDAEEFHAKLEQIGADRTKGTMITPVGFDEGTVEYARSKGIGLWRYIPSGSLVRLMEDSRAAADSDILRALMVPQTTEFRFYGFFYGLACTGELTTDRGALIRAELQDAVES